MAVAGATRIVQRAQDEEAQNLNPETRKGFAWRIEEESPTARDATATLAPSNAAKKTKSSLTSHGTGRARERPWSSVTDLASTSFSNFGRLSIAPGTNTANSVLRTTAANSILRTNGAKGVSDNAAKLRELLHLRKEFDALAKQHKKLQTKAEESLGEMRRLRVHAEEQEKAAAMLQRWVERLHLDKDQLEAAAAAHKAYVHKLEYKLANEIKGPEGMERLQLREKVRDLKLELESHHAITSSLKSELTEREAEIQQLKDALRIRAAEFTESGIAETQPSMLMEVAQEREEKVALALKLGQAATEAEKMRERIAELDTEVAKLQAEMAAGQAEMVSAMETLKRSNEKQLSEMNMELRQKTKELEALVVDRDNRLAGLERDLVRTSEELHRAKEDARYARETKKEEEERAKVATARASEEQRRAQQLAESLQASARALEAAQAAAKRHVDEARADSVSSAERQALRVAAEAERAREANGRVLDMEKKMEEMKRNLAVEVERAKGEAREEAKAAMAAREEEVRRFRARVEEEVKASSVRVVEYEKELASRRNELEACAERQADMAIEIENLHTEIEHFVQMNQGIQSDLQKECQQHERERSRGASLARQVSTLESQMEAMRKERGASEASLRGRVEELLQECQVMIEQRDQMKVALHEAMTKGQSLLSTQARITEETEQLRRQLDDASKSKASTQKTMAEHITQQQAQIDRLHILNRDLEATVVRNENNIDRLKVLVESERKSNSALSRQLASLRPMSALLIASHLSPPNSPPPTVPDPALSQRQPEEEAPAAFLPTKAELSSSMKGRDPHEPNDIYERPTERQTAPAQSLTFPVHHEQYVTERGSPLQSHAREAHSNEPEEQEDQKELKRTTGHSSLEEVLASLRIKEEGDAPAGGSVSKQANAVRKSLANATKCLLEASSAIASRRVSGSEAPPNLSGPSMMIHDRADDSPRNLRGVLQRPWVHESTLGGTVYGNDVYGEDTESEGSEDFPEISDNHGLMFKSDDFYEGGSSSAWLSVKPPVVGATVPAPSASKTQRSACREGGERGPTLLELAAAVDDDEF